MLHKDWPRIMRPSKHFFHWNFQFLIICSPLSCSFFFHPKYFTSFFFIKASNLSSLCVSENVYFSILDFFRNNLYTTNCIHLDVSLYANTRNTPTTVKVQTFPSPPEDYLWPFAVYPYLCPSSRKPHICFMSLSIILQFI